MTTLRQAGQSNWSTRGRVPTDIEVQTGCLQRIADATEAMAKRHVELIDERDGLRRAFVMQREETMALRRSNASLRGCITRLKRELGEALDAKERSE